MWRRTTEYGAMSRIPLEVGGGEDEMIGPAEVERLKWRLATESSWAP